MYFFKKRKPRKTTFDLSKTQPGNIIWVCRTMVIDKIIIERSGKEFSQSFADAMAEINRFYFVVDINGCYDVISSVLFEPFMRQRGDYLKNPELFLKTDRPAKGSLSDKCMEHYINSLK